jgi:SAM-dependent methyltransferase
MGKAPLSCPLCGASEFRELYVAQDAHYGISGAYPVVRCTHCSVVFLSPMYSDEELQRIYESLQTGNYFAYQNHFQPKRWKELLKKLLGYSTGTKDPKFDSPGVVLDLGCGTGWFLKVMRDRGWQAYGVEINESAASLGRQVKGLEISCGSLQQAKFPSSFFDYVRSNHSFEHITCPKETLDEVYRVLKPRGKLFLGVPNVDSLNSRLFKQYWWHLAAPVHPFSYSVETLSCLLAKHSFQVEKITFNSDYFGMVGSFQMWLNRDNGKKSMEGFVVNSMGLRLIGQWITNLVDLAGYGDMLEITAVKAN